METDREILRLARAARRASRSLGALASREKNAALTRMAEALTARREEILRANRRDLRAAGSHYPPALVDRLRLDEDRVAGMSRCLRATAALADPVGDVLQTIRRPNGLVIKRVRVPIGVVGVVYEARPNVTSDCVGLCLKAGDAVILRGGREAWHSNRAIHRVLRAALADTVVPPDAVQFVPTVDRAALRTLLRLDGEVDLVIPRGGEGLIRFIAEHASVPVIKHYKGVCHTYVGAGADLDMARRICFNAKVQRPGVCNAMETMLVHTDVADRFLPGMIRAFQEAGVRIRGCPRTRRILRRGVEAAKSADWEAEYLDLVLAVKVVASIDEAVDHVNTFGSHHSDAVVTDDRAEAEVFLRGVDSACVYVNASTRFTDGYEFGFGAEIGISTDKIHARGPMGIEGLTTYKYEIHGRGQIRE